MPNSVFLQPSGVRKTFMDFKAEAVVSKRYNLANMWVVLVKPGGWNRISLWNLINYRISKIPNAIILEMDSNGLF